MKKSFLIAKRILIASILSLVMLMGFSATALAASTSDLASIDSLGLSPTPKTLTTKMLQDSGGLALMELPKTLPVSYDNSSNYPAPGNQGKQGSCASWATAYAYKAAQDKVDYGFSIIFSPAYLYNQLSLHNIWYNENGVLYDNSGTSLYDNMKMIKAQGVCTWSDMPYNDKDSKTQPTQAQRDKAYPHRSTDWTVVKGTKGCKEAIYSTGGVAIGIPVYNDFDVLKAGNDVYDKYDGYYRGDHAICLVGWDDSKGAFKFINSWGSSWGIGGFGWISYDIVNNNFEHPYESDPRFAEADLDVTGYVMYDYIEFATVTFDPNGGTLASTSVKKGTDSAIGTLPTPTRANYTFQGWYTAKTGGTKIATTTKVTANVTYYAQWKINSYTVTLNPNGGTTTVTSVAKTYGSAIGTLPIPWREAFTFQGWYTAKSGGTKITDTAKVTANVTYYAQWKSGNPAKYKVTFDPCGGLVSPTTMEKYHGWPIATLPTPTRAGHAFQGWYTAKSGGTKIATTTQVLANATYYAQWKINSYKATFDPNGGTVTPTSVTKEYGSAIGTLPTPARTGYTFQGWYTAKTGGTKIATTTKVAANVTYYAQWKINSYTVTFNPNGGIVSPATVTKTYGSAIGTLPTPTLKDHTFLGWYTELAGGTKITTAQLVLKAVTYYAQWRPNLDGKVVSLAAYGSSRVFDISSASKADAAPLVLWDNTYRLHQRFKLTLDAQGYYTITNVNSGRVLDVSNGNTSNGAAIIQWTKKNSDNQKWKILRNANGTYTIFTKLNEKMCIDLPAGATANNTKPALWAWGANKSNQQFTIVDANILANGTYTIASLQTPTLLVDIKGGSTANGTAAILWTATGGANQKFKFTYNSATGYYSIANIGSGKVLDVNGANTAAGTAVVQWAASSALNQQWALAPDGKGNFVIYSAHSGRVLDAKGGAQKNGTFVIWDYNGGSNQKWILKKIA
jgi:uncharacterized repeat protein (TIGR02543 family)